MSAPVPGNIGGQKIWRLAEFHESRTPGTCILRIKCIFILCMAAEPFRLLAAKISHHLPSWGSFCGHAVRIEALDLAVSEGQVPTIFSAFICYIYYIFIIS